MKKLIHFLFSMSLAGILLLILAISMAVATFIENDFGTLAAKELVYNSWWFELLLFIFSINLAGSIVINKLWQRKKYAAFIFHISFLVIILGAVITRYIGYEGTMFIREGKTSDIVYSQTPYIQIEAKSPEHENNISKPKVLSRFSNNHFEKKIQLGNKTATFRLIEFIPNAAQKVTEISGGKAIITLVSSGKSGRKELLISEGNKVDTEGLTIGFANEYNYDFNINYKNDSLTFASKFNVINTDMISGTKDTLYAGSIHPLNPRQLYSIGEAGIVIKELYPTAKISYVESRLKSSAGSQNALIFEVNYNDERKEIAAFGGQGYLSEPVNFQIKNTDFSVAYGPKKIKLPFMLKLVDFQLDRYPGSNSPSSYASEVILIDKSNDLQKPYRIFMNNVLNYGGYRFFQSSYDQDEKGTILSVNHDYYGTLVTYIGYFLLTLGMLVSFFEKNSRFRFLLKSSRKISNIQTNTIAILITAFALFSFNSYGQVATNNQKTNEIDKKHAEAFGKLLVQDNGGRTKPVNTLSSEVIRKVAKKDKINGMNPDQVFLGMNVNPAYWQTVPMIKVGHEQVKQLIGISGSKAGFLDFFDMSGQGFYKLREAVELAYQKNPAQRSKFDNEIIKVDERVNICFLTYNGSLLKIFPIPDDPENKWVTSSEFPADSADETSVFARNIISMYFDSIKTAQATGNWESAENTLTYIKTFQNKYGKQFIPAERKIYMEILYNKMNIFKRLYQVYGLLGFVMIVLLIINILNPKYKFRIPLNIIFVLLFLGFLLQTYGLIVRWYISGHAPWSNGYESMIYIGWASMLAGLLFARKSKMALATTAVFTSLILMVAHLSWMDPQITNLVPVLKSYWLVIHVAVITASYSFLGLGAIMAFINLLLLNFMTAKNRINLERKIKEMSYIIEMGLIIGLVLLTIGTFLGGVWANESWGRYWGWDPKETWALITILFYSFILHMRLIPGFKGLFAFNFASLIAYGSVLMTYFGVNYYLSGLHSYAQGDPVPVPSFVYYTVAVIAVISIMGYINFRKFTSIEKNT